MQTCFRHSGSARRARTFPWLGAVLLAIFAGLAPASTIGAERSERIVALGGSVTEILYELGLGARIVAVDTTSVFPPEALATKPHVGYLRQLSAEGILSANPSLVIALDGAGPPDILKLVTDAGVPVARVPEDLTAEGVGKRVLSVAAAVGQDAAGLALAKRIESRFAAMDAARPRIARPLRALFVLSAQNGKTMVGGRNSAADAILALAGAVNAAAEIEGYKPFSDESVIAARPDVVVMMSSGPGGAPPPDLLAGPAFAQTPAGRDGRLVAMDGQYLVGFGPRTPEAARDLMRAFYPDLSE